MSITRRVDGGVATLTMDDGKVNAFDLAFFAELDSMLDDCADDAAVVVAGRPGMFSAGLHTKLVADLDRDGMAQLLRAFGTTMLRVWLEPRPVVAAVGGHAVAGGTILAMCADHAVAAAGDYRWGLIETTLGVPLPGWVITIARGNVRADRFDGLLLPGRSVDPAQALEVGFADELVAAAEVLRRAEQVAAQLATLDRPTYAETKRRLRGPQNQAALTSMEADLRGLLDVRERSKTQRR
ncbi:enoyl-CoA hydratase/isomerase family protein [soil metagenome]